MSEKQAPDIVSWDETPIAKSPMKIFRNHFWFIRTFGFPFTIEDAEATRFSDKQKLLKTILFNLIPVALSNCGLLVALLMFMSSVSGMIAYQASIGFKSWDTYSMIFLPVPNAVAPFAFYFSYSGMAERLTKFVRESEALEDLLCPRYVQLEQALTYLRKQMMIIYCLSFVVNVSMVVSYFMMYRKSGNTEMVMADGPLTVIVISSVIFMYNQMTSPIGTGKCIIMKLMIIVFISFTNFTFSASIALILHIMTYLDQTLNSFSLRVAAEASTTTKGATGILLKQILRNGATLISLCEQGEELLGPITITLYFIHLILSAAGIFFGTSLAQGLMTTNCLVIAYGFSNLLMSACSIRILWSLGCVGQRMCTSFVRVKKNLQDLFIAKATILSANERAQIDVLIERYSKDSPMRPMDMFSMNRASGISMSGLILTYIIVLLQFKTGES
jgi:hypothetical protein